MELDVPLIGSNKAALLPATSYLNSLVKLAVMAINLKRKSMAFSPKIYFTTQFEVSENIF